MSKSSRLPSAERLDIVATLRTISLALSQVGLFADGVTNSVSICDVMVKVSDQVLAQHLLGALQDAERHAQGILSEALLQLAIADERRAAADPKGDAAILRKTVVDLPSPTVRKQTYSKFVGNFRSFGEV